MMLEIAECFADYKAEIREEEKISTNLNGMK